MVPNRFGRTSLPRLALPATLERADLIVSIPKMKTHHWAGVTLSIKNLFGVMPGIFYGWPKNVLHYAGIGPSILDIAAAVSPTWRSSTGSSAWKATGRSWGRRSTPASW